MSENTKFAVAVVVIGAVFTALAGCQPPGGNVDLSPIRDGLSLIGLGIVLASIIRLLGGRKSTEGGDDEKHP